MTVQSRLIGEILVEKDVITRAQLERALDLQKQTGDRLGEIVVAEFGISRLELAGVLADQWAALEGAEPETGSETAGPASAPEPVRSSGEPGRRLIGEIFVEQGFVDTGQIEAALAVQRETGARLGEILIEQGTLSRLDLAGALAEQWSALQKLRPPTPAAGSELGEVEPPTGVAAPSSGAEAVVVDLRDPHGAPAIAPEARLDEVAAATSLDVDGVLARLQAVESESLERASAIDQLVRSLARKPDVSAIEMLRERIEELVAGRDGERGAGLLEARIGELERRLTATPPVSELRDELRQIAESADTERESLAHALFARVEELTALAPRTDEVGELRARLDELVAHSSDAPSLEPRLDELAGRVESLGGVGDALAGIHEALAQMDSVSVGDALATGARLAGLDAAVAELAAVTDRLDTSLGHELGERVEGLLARLESAEVKLELVAGLEQRLSSLAADVAGGSNAELLAALGVELRAELALVAARVEQSETRLRGELESQKGDVLALLEEERRETAALRSAVAELRDDAARGTRRHELLATLVEQRLEELGLRLAAEIQGVRSGSEEARLVAEAAGAAAAAAQDEAMAARLAAEASAAELPARLDDYAAHSYPATVDVAQALREELVGLAARVEERDAEEIMARDDLRLELESLVASVERRLDEQAALGNEQVRVTERALRKGLASLGKQLASTESTYAESGNALRRSIERLGAAVVDADVRIGDSTLPIEQQGCVAFAPTAAGYRLVEIPGAPPELGGTIELECCDGPLVVTRYGRSPLPLDPRPCAYLDRA